VLVDLHLPNDAISALVHDPGALNLNTSDPSLKQRSTQSTAHINDFAQTAVRSAACPLSGVPLERGSSNAGDSLRAPCDPVEGVITPNMYPYSALYQYKFEREIYIYIFVIILFNVSSLASIDGT